MKFKWKVQAKETGRYASFHARGWPVAEFANGQTGAFILCEGEARDATGRCGVDYSKSVADSGNHPPLKLMVNRFTDGKRFSLKGRFATLAEAKDAYARFLAQPENAAFLPTEE